MNFSKLVFRFLSIEIENIKNVENGKIYVSNGYSKKNNWKNYCLDKSDIIGVYGQNGSGKTSLIDALTILKAFVSDKKFFIRETNKNIIEEYLTRGKNNLTIKTFFLITDNVDSRILEYKFCFEKLTESKTLESYIKLKNEKFSIYNSDLSQEENFINYSVDFQDSVIEPTSLQDKFIKKTGEKSIVLQLSKALSQNYCSSFLFNSEFSQIEDLTEIDSIFQYLSSFKKYILSNFFIVPKNFMELFSFTDVIPLAIKSDSLNQDSFINFIELSLKSSQFVENKMLPIFNSLITELDTVINSIIPDMHLKPVVIKSEMSSQGIIGDVIEVVSVRNNQKIPLRYESDGIKKLLCILNLLIFVHNNSNFFIAIDELDASIFEYLLGEVLSMISESGKGQLLFTSHNLYPLEILDKDSIFFTTTNATKRYIKFKYLKPNHNLRDQYLKTIRLGGQEEEIYNRTKLGTMRLAFYTAGNKFDEFINDFIKNGNQDYE